MKNEYINLVEATNKPKPSITPEEKKKGNALRPNSKVKITNPDWNGATGTINTRKLETNKKTGEKFYTFDVTLDNENNTTYTGTTSDIAPIKK